MKFMQISLRKGLDYKELRNLLLFFLGKTTSVFGTSIYTFTLGLYVLKITGSSLSFAVTLIFGTLPMIVINPLAGVIADRFDKKKVVVLMDSLNGLLLIVIYIVSSFYGLNLILIYTTTFILTVFTTIFGIAMESAVPNIVSEKMLLNINSMSKIIDSASSILGPMLGGLVFALLDIRFFLLINGISFIFSAICEFFMDFRFNYHSAENISDITKINFFTGIKDGFKYIYERKNIKSLFIILISLNFFLGFSITVPLPYIINTVLNLGSHEFGVIEGAFPLGMILGALLVKRISEKFLYSKLLRYLSFILAFCIFLTGLPVIFVIINFNHKLYLIYYCIVMTAFGITIALIDIPLAYMMQRIIPDEIRGRVLSIGISIGKVLLPAALLISGALLNLVPAYIMPITGGVLLLIVNIVSTQNQSF